MRAPIRGRPTFVRRRAPPAVMTVAAGITSRPLRSPSRVQSRSPSTGACAAGVAKIDTLVARQERQVARAGRASAASRSIGDEDRLARPRDLGHGAPGERRAGDDPGLDDDAAGPEPAHLADVPAEGRPVRGHRVLHGQDPGEPPVGADRSPGPTVVRERAERIVEAVVCGEDRVAQQRGSADPLVSRHIRQRVQVDQADERAFAPHHWRTRHADRLHPGDRVRSGVVGAKHESGLPGRVAHGDGRQERHGETEPMGRRVGARRELAPVDRLRTRRRAWRGRRRPSPGRASRGCRSSRRP